MGESLGVEGDLGEVELEPVAGELADGRPVGGPQEGVPPEVDDVVAGHRVVAPLASPFDDHK